MHVCLTPELEAFVARKVASGEYASASEVVRAGLRRLDTPELQSESPLDEVRRKL